MRTVREKSSTGIYHVMLRGVNKQVIFEQSGDYLKFVTLLQQSVEPKDNLGKLLPPKCRFYAYCLMPNHVHLVIQEKQESISETIQRIATAYALYYNKKYERCGHLFQDRFKSEPVNDEGYFLTLLRYVHQNPVAGGLCHHAEDYEWSSWREYIGRAQKGQPPLCPDNHPHPLLLAEITPKRKPESFHFRLTFHFSFLLFLQGLQDLRTFSMLNS